MLASKPLIWIQGAGDSWGDLEQSRVHIRKDLSDQLIVALNFHSSKRLDRAILVFQEKTARLRGAILFLSWFVSRQVGLAIIWGAMAQGRLIAVGGAILYWMEIEILGV